MERLVRCVQSLHHGEVAAEEQEQNGLACERLRHAGFAGASGDPLEQPVDFVDDDDYYRDDYYR